MPGKSQRRVFRFGVFEADESTGELRKHGVRIKLRAQPFELLVMLLERPAELVTREEMQERLWGGDTFVDFDHGLNSAVNKLRDALGDSAAQPRLIETLAGRGYRFIAPVTVVAKAAPEIAASTDVGELAVAPTTDRETAVGGNREGAGRSLLARPEDLPTAPRRLVGTLLLLTQAMYLAFYIAALANLEEIGGILTDLTTPPPSLVMTLLVASAGVLIPVRLFLLAAVAFDYSRLSEKFRRLFPVLLPLDLLWALSPFLLIHHINFGIALAMTAALLYLPFAQRSLVLMFGRR